MGAEELANTALLRCLISESIAADKIGRVAFATESFQEGQAIVEPRAAGVELVEDGIVEQHREYRLDAHCIHQEACERIEQELRGVTAGSWVGRGIVRAFRYRR